MCFIKNNLVIGFAGGALISLDTVTKELNHADPNFSNKEG